VPMQEGEQREKSREEVLVDTLALPLVTWMNGREQIDYDVDVLVNDDIKDEDRFLQAISVAVAVETLKRTGARALQVYDDLKTWVLGQ